MFPTIGHAGHVKLAAVKPWRWVSGGGCQSSTMAALLNSLSVVFTNSFLPPKYRVKYYDYIVMDIA